MDDNDDDDVAVGLLQRWGWVRAKQGGAAAVC